MAEFTKQASLNALKGISSKDIDVFFNSIRSEASQIEASINKRKIDIRKLDSVLKIINKLDTERREANKKLKEAQDIKDATDKGNNTSAKMFASGRLNLATQHHTDINEKYIKAIQQINQFDKKKTSDNLKEELLFVKKLYTNIVNVYHQLQILQDNPDSTQKEIDTVFKPAIKKLNEYISKASNILTAAEKTAFTGILNKTEKLANSSVNTSKILNSYPGKLAGKLTKQIIDSSIKSSIFGKIVFDLLQVDDSKKDSKSDLELENSNIISKMNVPKKRNTRKKVQNSPSSGSPTQMNLPFGGNVTVPTAQLNQTPNNNSTSQLSPAVVNNNSNQASNQLALPFDDGSSTGNIQSDDLRLQLGEDSDILNGTYDRNKVKGASTKQDESDSTIRIFLGDKDFSDNVENISDKSKTISEKLENIAKSIEGIYEIIKDTQIKSLKKDQETEKNAEAAEELSTASVSGPINIGTGITGTAVSQLLLPFGSTTVGSSNEPIPSPTQTQQPSNQANTDATSPNDSGVDVGDAALTTMLLGKTLKTAAKYLPKAWSWFKNAATLGGEAATVGGEAAAVGLGGEAAAVGLGGEAAAALGGAAALETAGATAGVIGAGGASVFAAPIAAAVIAALGAAWAGDKFLNKGRGLNWLMGNKNDETKDENKQYNNQEYNGDQNQQTPSARKINYSHNTFLKNDKNSEIIGMVVDELIKNDITDPEKQKAIIAQLYRESLLDPLQTASYKFTTAKRLKEVFPSEIKKHPEVDISTLLNNPEGLTEFVYGPESIQGKRHGHTQKGEGYKYRERGLLQLLGKDTYAAAGKGLGLDLVNHPELLNDPEISAKATAWFFSKFKNVNSISSNDPEEIMRKITSMTTGVSNFKGGIGAEQLKKAKEGYELTKETVELAGRQLLTERLNKDGGISGASGGAVVVNHNSVTNNYFNDNKVSSGRKGFAESVSNPSTAVRERLGN